MKHKKGWYAAGAVVLALIAGAFFVARLYFGQAVARDAVVLVPTDWPTRCDPGGRSPISNDSI